MKPRDEGNFLLEVTPETYQQIKLSLSDEEVDAIELHYSPYWNKDIYPSAEDLFGAQP